MININKKYTCNGKPVINLQINLKNSAGEMVTYPVKGTIVLSEKPWRTKYCIWSIDGIYDIVWGNGYNLIECKANHD